MLVQAHGISKQVHDAMMRELASWTKEVEIFKRQLSSCKETQAMLDRNLKSERVETYGYGQGTLSDRRPRSIRPRSID